jgi:putative peptidoglycan lipid II flippase
VSTAKQSTSLLRGSSIVGALTMLSRVLGFFRDLLMARLLGAGLYADAFVVAFRIPNLLRSIFAEGAFTSGFVPSFSEERVKGVAVARKALCEVFTVLLLASGIIACLGILGAGLITQLFAPGFAEDPEKFWLVTTLTQIMLPYIVFVSIVAMANGALNAFEVFGVGALGQVVMNLVMIAGILLSGLFDSKVTSTLLLGVSVLLGGISQVLTLFPYLRKNGLTLSLVRKPFTPVVKQTLQLMLPAVVGGAVYQLNLFVNTLLASLLRDGSVSWLYYADRLAQLPIGVFTMALASVLLPTLSLSFAKGEYGKFEKDLTNSLRYTAFAILPLAGVLWFFSEPLIRVLLERGEFDPLATSMSALALQGYAVGLWFTSSYSMFVRGFLAQKKPHIPTFVGIVTLVSNLFFALVFMGPVSSGGIGDYISSIQRLLPFTQDLGHVGLALSSSLSSGVSLLVIALTFQLSIPGASLAPFLSSTIRSLLAVVSAMFAIAALGSLTSYELLDIASKGIVFVILYFAVQTALRASEVGELVTSLNRIFRKIRSRIH